MFIVLIDGQFQNVGVERSSTSQQLDGQPHRVDSHFAGVAVDGDVVLWQPLERLAEAHLVSLLCRFDHDDVLRFVLVFTILHLDNEFFDLRKRVEQISLHVSVFAFVAAAVDVTAVDDHP